jgi:hypothetical protein
MAISDESERGASYIPPIQDLNRVIDWLRGVPQKLRLMANLIAATLCTIGSGVGTVALFMSEPTFVNYLAGAGAGVGTIGGFVWILAAWLDRR